MVSKARFTLSILRKNLPFISLALLIVAGFFIPVFKPNSSIPESKKVVLDALSLEPSVQTFSIIATVSAKPNSEREVKAATTTKGDDLLVLINKSIRLPTSYEPKDLVFIDNSVQTVRLGMVLRKEASDALKEMAQAAKTDGANLIILSSYRSYWEQQNTFSGWVASAGLQAAQTFSARPGYSQHQLGSAVDFTSDQISRGLASDFEKTKEGLWLAANAFKYGFVLSYPKGEEAVTGYTYEPWHYRYIGGENAQKMINSGLILENYLRRFGVW